MSQAGTTNDQVTAMTSLFARICLALAVVALATRPAAAQWETPSRAFHKDTAFPLDGRHLTVACAACHISGVTKGTPTACVTCHWVRRQDDPYRTRLGSSCEQCHRTTSWAAVKWDHAAATGMPLNLAHKTLDCAGCHKNRTFTAANASCITCHQRDFDRTTNPNHAAAGFSTLCTECHRVSDSTFTGPAFNHSTVFPLVGQHATQNCATCHVSGRYRGTPRDCIGCHQDDYDRTAAPHHASAGFSTNCEGCHRPTDASWKGPAINHNAHFPLVGQHAVQSCAGCHAGNRYQGTPRDCVGCHRDDYDRTSKPNHAAAGLSTECDSCHKASDSSWLGIGLDHNQFFQLQGRHVTAACAACHVGGVYKGTARDCYSCHRSQYERTASPSHAATGFPTTCDACHRASDTLWTQGRFTHTWFPITTGKHAGNPCSACHQDPNNYAQFTCLTCHGRTKTDDQHKGRTGYRYDSIACYSCHPTGKGD
jgi:hypothetical protein